LDNALSLSAYLRQEISKMEGISLFGEDIVGKSGCYAFDPTKITIKVCDLGISGFEMERILFQEFKIQVELSDLFNVMFLISIGDEQEKIDYLINALKEIASRFYSAKVTKLSLPLPEVPPQVLTPREAFCYPGKVMELHRSIGEVSAEAIMAYPPGIPIISPGERITSEVIDYLNLLKHEGASLQGTEDSALEYIKVIRASEQMVNCLI
jgi:arginine decarboxylase